QGLVTRPDPSPLIDAQGQLPDFFLVLKKADAGGGGDAGTGVRLLQMRAKDFQSVLNQIAAGTTDAHGETWVSVYHEEGAFTRRPTEFQRLGSLPYRLLTKGVWAAVDAINEWLETPEFNNAFPYLAYNKAGDVEYYQVQVADSPTLPTLNKYKLLPLTQQVEGAAAEINYDQLDVVGFLQGTETPASGTVSQAAAVDGVSLANGGSNATPPQPQAAAETAGGAPMSANAALKGENPVHVASCWEVGGNVAGDHCAGERVIPSWVEVMPGTCPAAGYTAGGKPKPCVNESDGVVAIKLSRDEDSEKNVLRVYVKHPWSYPESVCSFSAATCANTARNYAEAVLTYFADEGYDMAYFKGNASTLPCRIVHFPLRQGQLGQELDEPPNELVVACPGRDYASFVNASLKHVASHPPATTVTVSGAVHNIAIPNTPQQGGYAFLIETNVTLCAGPSAQLCRSLRYDPFAFVSACRVAVDVNGQRCTFTSPQRPSPTGPDVMSQVAAGACDGINLTVGGPFNDYLVLGVKDSLRPTSVNVSVTNTQRCPQANSLNYSIPSGAPALEGQAVLQPPTTAGFVAPPFAHQEGFTAADNVIDEVEGIQVGGVEFKKSGSKLIARFAVSGSAADWAVFAFVNTSTSSGWEWMETSFEEVASGATQEIEVSTGGAPAQYRYIAELFICEEGWVIGSRAHNEKLREAINAVNSGSEVPAIVRQHCVIAHVHLNHLT
ncbi:MAG: hypothetical protein AB1626_04410, partial [Candidatus Micrarchaeota archaeon]